MHTAPTDDLHHGLVVYRASRLEALLDPLLTLLDSAPPADVLAPQTVIAAHPGMRHWLAGALARRRGPAGIVANLRISLPSTWLDELALSALGSGAVALTPYRRDRLRWRIHHHLPAVDDAAVRAYLAGADAPRRRYQLADRLARLYTQYLVYRPDWLAAWQRGRDDVPEATFMAPLWRQLRADIGLPHRGERVDALVQDLARRPQRQASDEPLHIFGVSHLAPAELALLRAVAQLRPVILYVPDPCRDYWAGLRGEREQLRERAQQVDFSEASEQFFLQMGHPLLASWGRMGQHFMLNLQAFDDAIAMDVRHWQDEAPQRGEGDGLLQRLQESMRQLDTTRVQPLRGGAAAALADRSLRVHLCHTRLRELEVLRDALLRELSERPDLKPSDIVVMAPDIAAYVPLLPAVFGEAGRHQGPLPYHLADVAVASTHPLLEAFSRLLSIPESRLAAPELLDLMQVPEVARALGLDDSDLDTLTRWLRQSRVAWALDGAFREGFGVPGIDDYTFAWGMDRLLAGYVMGDASDQAGEGWTLPGGELWPVEGVHGPQAAVLGALDRLLLALAELHRDAGTPRSASAWATRLESLLDTLFRVDPRDHEAVEALSLLRRFLQATKLETADCGLDPVLDFSVVREVLRERLAAAPERQRFLLGGITFCGMVPQRAIPFRVIAVLGLNDGEFPRTVGDAGLDLMQRHRRLGDRDVRNDDRYLFLETVMAAREVLHLSYLGEGIRDGKPRNPAAPLAELLGLLDEQAGLRGEDGDIDERPAAPGAAPVIRRPWRIRHPLQPFDARYFDGSDPRLFSFDAGFAGMVRGEAGGSFMQPAAGPAPMPAATVPLREVQAYFRDPARQVLAQQLNIRLDALDDDPLQDSEPLQAGFSALDQVAKRLFFEAIERGAFALPEQAPAWLRLSGMLPSGRLGTDAWTSERAAVQALLERAQSHPLFAPVPPRRQPVSLALALGPVSVEGTLERVFGQGDGLWLFEAWPGRKTASLSFAQRIPLFLEWALLRLSCDLAVPVHVGVLTADGGAEVEAPFNAWAELLALHLRNGDHAAADAMRAALGERVTALLAWWQQAQQQPQHYFPRTSWAALDERDDAARLAWEGSGFGIGERDFAPGYARLLAGAARFEPGHADHAALQALARRLAALIDPVTLLEPHA
ncbi:exodeoxyribonuclease V subunit gamma [Dyella sp.]|jgi:exodeoxyribonuclease V gamma subunit|uniref:exodeoxyribonuclease V subunit gamma n=1 Tax=Dyella sp. TaxID=1869338 RepID=UPI002D77599C|nr:exodeoxyribonuclease V subunit gamma [Dyella sp.]HET6431147.1 exodeoxyribonuclease V subunit gamma [Dyella sp.]